MIVYVLRRQSERIRSRSRSDGLKTRLIIDGNAVYEIDEECEACLRGRKLFLEEEKQKEKVKEKEQNKEEQK